MEDMSNAIEVRNLYKEFKVSSDKPSTLKERLVFGRDKKAERKSVLRDISLDIKKGDTVALVGTNGSGKSTLLKLMTRILYPNQGTVEVNGRVTSLLELGAGFHQDFTGRENIYFNASIFGLTREQIDKRIDDVIAFSELGEAIDTPVRTYSSGMYMRLAFSVAINVDADILLIDEILAVGDQYFQDKCFNKLEELRKSDTTVVIVSHSLEMVKKLCDRAIWIYKGDFKLDGDPYYVISEYLEQIYIDNKVEKKKAVSEGKDNYSGAVFFDFPKDFSHIKKERNKVSIRGWAVSDCEDSNFELTIGDMKVPDIVRIKRPDVIEVYAEKYGLTGDSDEVGWTVEYELPSQSEIGENNKLFIVASIYDHEQNIIDSKELVLYVDYNEEDKNV